MKIAMCEVCSRRELAVDISWKACAEFGFPSGVFIKHKYDGEIGKVLGVSVDQYQGGDVTTLQCLFSDDGDVSGIGEWDVDEYELLGYPLLLVGQENNTRNSGPVFLDSSFINLLREQLISTAM